METKYIVVATIVLLLLIIVWYAYKAPATPAVIPIPPPVSTTPVSPITATSPDSSTITTPLNPIAVSPPQVAAPVATPTPTPSSPQPIVVQTPTPPALTGGSAVVSTPMKMYFIVNAGFNMFSYYHLNDRKHDVLIPTGIYTMDQMAAALQTALSNEEPGWKVSFDQTSCSFTFTNNNFRWDRCDDPQEIYTYLGLPTGQQCGVNWKNTETTTGCSTWKVYTPSSPMGFLKTTSTS